MHMHHVQIELTDEQLDALTRQAEVSGQDVATLVRRAVDVWVVNEEHEAKVRRALEAVGGFHSGLGDLADRHDDYLGEPEK